MWPETGTTKAEVIDYYARIAPALLPHLRGRPLTLVRFPNGVAGQKFFEKRRPPSAPDWVRSEPIEMGSVGTVEFVVCDDLATLVWLAQLATLELHPSLSLAERPDVPTVLAFDLDPGPPAGIRECCAVALRVRELARTLKLEAFAKTSGSKGIQVYVPLNGDQDYEVVKPFANEAARALERQAPDLIVSKMTKKLREGKVFVDWSQNTRSKTTVAVYSLRARDRPTISTPITWEEAEAGAAGDDELRFEAGDVLARVEEHGDLFAPVLELRQELPGADALPD